MRVRKSESESESESEIESERDGIMFFTQGLAGLMRAWRVSAQESEWSPALVTCGARRPEQGPPRRFLPSNYDINCLALTACPLQ